MQKYTNVVNICDYMSNPFIIYNNYDEIVNSYNLLVEEIFNYNLSINCNEDIKYMFTLAELSDYKYQIFNPMPKNIDEKKYICSEIDIYSKMDIDTLDIYRNNETKKIEITLEEEP